MAHLSLNMLGELQVLIDGVPISSFESDKVRTLLAYLALESGRSHRRESLLELLWPDASEAAARHNLSQALFNLWLGLGDHTAKPPYLLVSREAIQFNRESDYSLDVDQFNGYFHGWQQNQGRQIADGSTLLLQMEDMIRLYRGEFLRGFSLGDSAAFEDWILVQRESMRQRVLDALAYLSNEYERRGDLQAARHHASRQLELDPWREEAHCQIMRLLALEGQRSAALAQYENCRKVLTDELGVEPSAKTRDLYEQIRLDTLQTKDTLPAATPVSPQHDLPAALTPFFGRERELAELSQLIADPECRCITLVGPGGIGKTRLALRAADENAPRFTHGSSFVALASVATLETVIPAMANAVHFAFYGPAEPKQQLINYLKDKQMLLVVDNVEHLLLDDPNDGNIADLLMELLQGARQIKLLVTSREAMNLQGDWPFQVQGLAFPGVEIANDMDQYGAVALFLQRARRSRPGFEVNADDIRGVARLCRLVEGMPLAIELAASWVRLLSPAEIATEVEQSVDFLSAEMRDLPQRHKSMRAVFDHSWKVLSAEEQQVLGRLSVFRGGFQRQAAERVASASLPVLSSLVMRSLLRRMATGRYDLHELIRQYAASRLAQDRGALQSTRDRHGSYYLDLLKAKAGALTSARQKDVLAELTKDMENIRAAWDWSITQHRFDSANGVSTVLWYIYELHNWWKEGADKFRDTAAAILAHMESTGFRDLSALCVQQAMLSHAAYFKFRLGRSVEAYSILASNARALASSQDPRSAISPLCSLGIVCWEQGRFSEASQSLRQSAELAQVYGERWSEAAAKEFLGIVEHEQGEYEEARAYLREALGIARQLGDPLLISHVLSYLGRTMRVLREYGEAEQQLRESIAVARQIDYRSGVGLGLDALALLLDAVGRHEEAQYAFQESVDLFREVGDTYRHSRVLNHQGMNFMASNQVVEARNAFLGALKMSHERNYVPSSLEALVGLAALAAGQSADSATLELILYVKGHPTSTREAQKLASRLQAELEPKLSREEIEAAKQGALSRSLDEIVRRALAWASQ